MSILLDEDDETLHNVDINDTALKRLKVSDIQDEPRKSM